ncbi:MAG: Cysteine-tRNA ligase [candidate division WS6 bacterium GW2011_GWA2_37_6]|uniref:Cysteine--tRNA ligase n=1 Tax=candidate division WS6 bacterium GW2011_GWA2_37_6 TaxID=1619087 RepID=A0A0G0JHQ5_9BACT|nr:MAG: Cysteine-tRNA ligase [candidate division WS6 bacterium GW2011_GWA2_37_6]
MKLYNTLTKELEELKPLKDNIVTFYQCGPTVYSHQHIGNLYSAVKGDLIRRSLKYFGYKVSYTRNITDVGHLVSDDDEGEDKMEKGAKRENLTPEEIAAKYTKLYHQDLEELNVLPPDHETIATKYVDQMARMVQSLIDKGFAYATDQAIYFEVAKFKNYNDLNRQDLEKNIKGAGHGDISDPGKKSPYDFSVWFFKTGKHENALQTWDKEFKGIKQPTKAGFPGWHIECSAMSKDTLGETIDVHMGGIEHIPVHHTNEIAQSEAANGVKFVNYWLHHEMLEVDGQKMSKSIGNVYTLNDVLKKGFDPMDLRYFFLQAHYRSKQNFTWEALEAAKTARNRLKTTLLKIHSQTEGKLGTGIDQKWNDKFKQALEEDFNISKALSILWDMLKKPNKDTYSTILKFDTVLGLEISKWEDTKEDWIKAEDLAIKELLKEREKAKKAKDFHKADEIRDKLNKNYGLEIIDTPEGQKLKTID